MWILITSWVTEKRNRGRNQSITFRKSRKQHIVRFYTWCESAVSSLEKRNNTRVALAFPSSFTPGYLWPTVELLNLHWFKIKRETSEHLDMKRIGLVCDVQMIFSSVYSIKLWQWSTGFIVSDHIYMWQQNLTSTFNPTPPWGEQWAASGRALGASPEFTPGVRDGLLQPSLMLSTKVRANR